MADQIDPEKIKLLSESIDRFTDSTKDAADRLKDAQERFGKQLGRTAADLGSSLYKGEKGAGMFGNALESAATALQTLILAIPGLGIAAKIGAVAIGALGKAANAAAKQSDALIKSYQEISKFGSGAADGMRGVFDNMQKFGYGIE